MSRVQVVAAAKNAPSISRSALPESADQIRSAVNRLAWPVIMENLFQTALGTASMIMVARLGASAIAGVGTATQILFVLQAAFGAVTTGTTVLVARFIGANDSESANKVTKQSLLLGAVISAIFAVLGFFYSEEAIAVLGTDAEVIKFGADYLRITSVTSILMVYMFVISGALRGAGDTRTPMVVTGLINVINVAVSYFLIFGGPGIPPLGVPGAAWGAAFARLVGTALLFLLLLRPVAAVNIRGRDGWLPEMSLIKRITKLGLPSMGEQLAMSGGMLLYGIIAISLGTLVYATQRVTFQALSISYMPGMGFAMAATAMVGQCLGACRSELSERATWHATGMAVLWMTCMGMLMVIFDDPIMRIFTNDPEMIAIGTDALRVIAFSQPFMAVSMVLAGSLRGAGDTRFPMVSTFLGVWLVRLPLGYLFGPVLGWGLSGIYIANVLDGVGRAVAQFWRYRSGSWRNIQV